MRRITAFKGNYAVSEVVGGLLLIVIAVISFAVISLYLIPDLDPIDEKIELVGYVSLDGNAVIEHIGGKSITDYKLVVNHINGTRIDFREYYNLDPPWIIGKCIFPLIDIGYSPLYNESDMVEVIIYNFYEEGGEQELFRGILSGSSAGYASDSPILISSLRTDTTDEDLICYSYPIIPDVNATTYIYNWELNGVSDADLNMPFDTENNVSCKDYSGSGLTGTLNGVTWIPSGIVGGAYHFGGSSEYITMSLPDVFSDIPNNDFSISIWVSSDDITADNAVVLMASEDNNNFVKIFLQGSEVHVGVCDNGVKDAVRTEDLSSSTWYHIVATWDADEKLITVYCNGNGSTLVGDRNFAVGSGNNLLEIGHGTASSKFWDGYMDELVVYDRALTQKHVYQMYLSTKDGEYDRRVLLSSETNVGDIWQCIVTPNDSIQDGTTVESNTIQIVNYPGGD